MRESEVLSFLLTHFLKSLQYGHKRITLVQLQRCPKSVWCDLFFMVMWRDLRLHLLSARFTHLNTFLSIGKTNSFLGWFFHFSLDFLAGPLQSCGPDFSALKWYSKKVIENALYRIKVLNPETMYNYAWKLFLFNLRKTLDFSICRRYNKVSNQLGGIYYVRTD